MTQGVEMCGGDNRSSWRRRRPYKSLDYWDRGDFQNILATDNSCGQSKTRRTLDTYKDLNKTLEISSFGLDFNYSRVPSTYRSAWTLREPEAVNTGTPLDWNSASPKVVNHRWRPCNRN